MADTFDAAGARAVGYSDQEIADYLGSRAGFDVPGAVKAGYSYTEIVDHLAPPPPPPKEAPPPEPQSGVLKGIAKAAGHEAIDVGGRIVSALGSAYQGAATGVRKLEESDRNAVSNRLTLFDRVDNGETVKPGEASDADRMLARMYQVASPNKRAEMRKQIEDQVAAFPPIEDTNVGKATSTVKELGADIAKQGGAISEKAQDIVPLTPEEQGRPTVIGTRMLVGLVPYVGAGVVGGQRAQRDSGGYRCRLQPQNSAQPGAAPFEGCQAGGRASDSGQAGQRRRRD